jgi:Type II secretion system (T2SS), protein M subtype b
MTLSPGFRRTLAWTVVSGVISLIWSYWPASSSQPAVAMAASADSVPTAEKTLAKLREAAATVPQKQEIFKRVSGDLAVREKGIIVADTAQQAQAQIMQVLRKLGHDENPPVEIRSQEFGAVRPLGDVYGEVFVTVQIDCGIDQLVNILVGLAARPELIASNELRVTSSNAKDKMIGVRLMVSGVVPRKLVPGKKAGAS